MTVTSFSGGAGCGKTFHLIAALRQRMATEPLAQGQRVLALSYMHGARIRLDEKLRVLPELRNLYDCSTVDSFGWRIVRRWICLARHLGFKDIKAHDFEAVVDAAGALIEQAAVVNWIAATYPVLVVDESQDLSSRRLRILKALATRIDVIAAADEFQCLDETLRPNPTCVWLEGIDHATELVKPERTKVQSLLDAAGALRSGGAPVTTKPNFQIALASNVPLAGTFLANAISWYGKGKRVAVITPADVSYARQVVQWVATNQTKKGGGPYQIVWEESETKATSVALAGLKLQEKNHADEVVASAKTLGNPRLAMMISEWLDNQRRSLGKVMFSQDEMKGAVHRILSARRRSTSDHSGAGRRAMTVHGAKNREFDQVVVLWPAAATGTDDQLRRLLYNAITRARERVLVLVQAKKSLNSAPFS